MSREELLLRAQMEDQGLGRTYWYLMMLTLQYRMSRRELLTFRGLVAFRQSMNQKPCNFRTPARLSLFNRCLLRRSRLRRIHANRTFLTNHYDKASVRDKRKRASVVTISIISWYGWSYIKCCFVFSDMFVPFIYKYIYGE